MLTFEEYLYNELREKTENKIVESKIKSKNGHEMNIGNLRGLDLEEIQNVYRKYRNFSMNSALFDHEIYTILYTIECLKNMYKIDVIEHPTNNRYIAICDDLESS